MILQHDIPDDFVIAARERQHSVRGAVRGGVPDMRGIVLEWRGEGIEEKGIVSEVANADCRVRPGDVIVEVDPRYFRPAEVETLLGDPSKAKKLLGWESKIGFRELIKEMVEADMKIAKRDHFVRCSRI